MVKKDHTCDLCDKPVTREEYPARHERIMQKVQEMVVKQGKKGQDPRKMLEVKSRRWTTTEGRRGRPKQLRTFHTGDPEAPAALKYVKPVRKKGKVIKKGHYRAI